MGELGFSELIVVALVAVLIFGPKKLPELGGGLGKAIREFKSAMRGGGSQPNEAEKEPDHLSRTSEQ